MANSIRSFSLAWLIGRGFAGLVVVVEHSQADGTSARTERTSLLPTFLRFYQTHGQENNYT